MRKESTIFVYAIIFTNIKKFFVFTFSRGSQNMRRYKKWNIKKKLGKKLDTFGLTLKSVWNMLKYLNSKKWKQNIKK